MRSRILVLVAALLAVAVPSSGSTSPAQAQDRSVDPVVLKGSQFPGWSAGPDVTAREPQAPGNPGATGGGIPSDPLKQSDCKDRYENEWDAEDDGDHSCYQESRIRNPGIGVPVDRLIGYRWTGSSYQQIPFQVDERFVRYLTNNASDFSAYSGVDQHDTYAFDREGFRFTDNAADDVCRPIPRRERDGSRPETTPDPVVGLDDNDELVLMYRDTGERAPSGSRPAGIDSLHEVAIADPSNPSVVRFAYVGLAAEDGPRPAFTAANSPYVRYEPDDNARSMFVYSQSSYDSYGRAPKGPHCDAVTGTPVRDPNGNYQIEQRRPLDTAWVRTPRYAFRYDGRWLMTELRVSEKADWQYGPDIIDRWKARAFQQDPSSRTPCCGYEEEDTNWGGSSILMGERSGPVRIIRETWGADSSTNNARREIFYRDLFVWGDALRVHPIPPLDGIYSQWDYNADRITRYFNPTRPDGVVVDGRNDEVFGNLDDPCNRDYDGRNAQIDETYRSTYRAAGLCQRIPYHQSIDVTDPTMNGVLALEWEQSSGPFGGMVTRTVIRDHTPGGDAQSFLAVPYYRDDSCFDDGTGTDPGPRRLERASTELKTYIDGSTGVESARRCWAPEHGLPDTSFKAGDQIHNGKVIKDEFGDERFFQGDIGAHGVHILFIAESDNAYQTVPLTEITTEQRVVVLPPTVANVGERYGRSLEYPLTTTVTAVRSIQQ